MRTHLQASQPAIADPWPAIERFQADPSTWLPPPASHLDGERYTMTVRLGPASQLVTVEVGEPWSLPDAVSRRFAWFPSDEHGERVHDRTLPGFDGRLTLRREEDRLSLSLEGTYVPPGGRIGAAADRLLLNRSGEATANALVSQTLARLTGTR